VTYRILHVHGGGGLGGVESWLANLARLTDTAEFELNIAAAELLPGEKIMFERHGSVVIDQRLARRPPGLLVQVHRILQQHGPYDAVHAHLDSNSGFVLAIAKACGVPVRIAHSHLDSHSLAESGGRRLYRALGKKLIQLNATNGLAASAAAATDMFGPHWRSDARWSVHPCGIDLEPFACPPDRGLVRTELCIPTAAFVVGHVGRFNSQKNHHFIFEIGKLLLKRRPDVYFLLVGDGPDRPSITRAFSEAGLGERVICPGNRYDVPRLMRGAMDAFVFPSLYEGLGLAVIEAQAAALPCIISDTIPEEVDVIPELISRLSLIGNPSLWADQIEMALSGAKYSPEAAQALLSGSRFNVVNEVKELLTLYRECINPADSLTGSALLSPPPGNHKQVPR
jgi:glycosyltransferase involved in cell wall biosynthesis